MTFMGVLGVKPSTKMDGLGSSFQYKESKYMVAEAMEKYTSDYEESDY